MLNRIGNRLLLLAAVLAGTISCSAESSDSTERNQALVLEIMGLGGYWSVNYERSLSAKDHHKIYLAAGYSGVHLTNYKGGFDPQFNIPVSIGLLLGAERRFFEVFASQVVSRTVSAAPESLGREVNINLHAAISAGYRYRWIPGRLYGKVYYSLVADRYETLRSWVGLGFGYAIR